MGICREFMIPGIGGLNPKKMQAMMKQLILKKSFNSSPQFKEKFLI